MTDQEYTSGEIQRALKHLDDRVAELTKEVSSRHHVLANQVAVIPLLTMRLENVEGDIKSLKIDSKWSRAFAQYVMGFAAALWIAIQFVNMWRH